MSPMPMTLETLASLGACLDLSAHTYMPMTLEKLVGLAANSGGTSSSMHRKACQ